jgi:hypothetical protein
VTQLFSKATAKAAAKQAGIVTIGCIGLGLFGVPSAHGQFDTAAIMTFLAQLNSTMQEVMAVPLQTMQQVNTDMANFTKTAIYPVTAITAAQNLTSQNLNQAVNVQNMINASTASAQMPTSQQLEATMLSKNPSLSSNVAPLYQQTYGVIPTSQTAPSSVTLAVDIGDAVAMESMKKAIALDALADSEMTVSQSLMSQLQTAAPGNVPIISAQAAAWILQAHAFSQTGTAQLLRAESAELGYAGASIKLHATISGNAAGGMFALPVGQ